MSGCVVGADQLALALELVVVAAQQGALVVS